jgi:hypothetical protein
MKITSHLAAVKAAAFATCVLAVTSHVADAENDQDATNSEADLSDNHKIPSNPVGWLTAFPTIVQIGAKPTISWSITYPSVVTDYVEIDTPATVVPKETLDVEVRVLGNGVTRSSSNSDGYLFVPARATLSFDGGGYNEIFYGDNHDVNPSTVVWSKTDVQAGQKLRFGGRFYRPIKKNWGPSYTSDSGTQNIRVLVNGDTPPSNIPEHDAPSLKDFIKPFLGGDGKVKIGPMDVIVFMELTHTDNQQNAAGYDLQDMVLLVTFTSNNPKNNNGQEYDANGGDSSNAPFMEYDSNPSNL